MRNKSTDAKIEFIGNVIPEHLKFWSDNMPFKTRVKNNEDKAYLTIKWHVPDDIKIITIRIKGKWHVNGLFCSDQIDDQVYVIPYFTLLESFKTVLKTESKQKSVIASSSD